MTKARLSESDLLSEESNEHLVVQHPVIIFIHSQPASQPPDRSVTARAGPSLRAIPGASQARHAVSAPARLAEWNVAASSVLSSPLLLLLLYCLPRLTTPTSPQLTLSA